MVRKRIAATLSALLALSFLAVPAAQAERGGRYDDRYDDRDEGRYERRSAPPPRRAYRDDGAYMVFKGGFYSPQSNDMDAIGFDPGFSGEFVIGKDVAPNLAVEGGLGYFRSEANTYTSVGATLYPATETFESVPATVSLRVHARADAVEPYLVGGVGVYFNTDTIEDDFGSFDQSSVSGGAHFGGGLNFHLSPGAFLQLETKYLWMTAKDAYDVNLAADGFRTSFGFGVRF